MLMHPIFPLPEGTWNKLGPILITETLGLIGVYTMSDFNSRLMKWFVNREL